MRHAEQNRLLADVLSALSERVCTQLDDIAEAVARPSVPTPGQWLDSVTTRRVLFHLKNGQSIEGLLAGNYPDGIVLTGPVMRLPDGKSTAMAGDVFVPRSEILLAQLDT